MTNPHGEHIWYELLTTDPDAAQAFYRDIIGWSVEDSGMSDMDYRLLGAPDGAGVAGLMKLPDGVETGPVWLGYVGVDDVDASVARITAGGGSVLMPAATMDGVGRMALVADPHGAAFYVMRGASDEESQAFRQSTPDSGDASLGHGVWNELAAPDAASALAFYHDQFGWTQDGAMPMGDLGDYRFLKGPRAVVGAVMDAPPGVPAGWSYYFHVRDIDAALAGTRARGGQVLQDAIEIPGGSFSAMIADPQGARIGLVGERARELSV